MIKWHFHLGEYKAMSTKEVVQKVFNYLNKTQVHGMKRLSPKFHIIVRHATS